MENIKNNLTSLGLTFNRIPGRGYVIGREDCKHTVMITDEFILRTSPPTKTIIHHTPECLEAQKEFSEFKEFIEGFGGYVPTPTCDCPREEVLKSKSETLEYIMQAVLQRLMERCSDFTLRT